MRQRDHFHEVVDEFRTVVAGRARILDAILPPLVFLVLNALYGPAIASYGALAVAAIFSLIRLIRKQPVGYALGGLVATAIAILAARLSNQVEGYFLPSLVSGGLTFLGCLISVVLRRPLVALTSHLARGWPLDWYWHPRVRPAYSEVTLAWAVFFALRLVVQWILFRSGGTTLVAALNVALGWPATLLLLVVSYLYGNWRLKDLSGPSVKEFERGAEPPWEGQQRGF